jgi:hypothetical protein
VHARHLQCRSGVDAADIGMRVRRPDNDGVKLIDKFQIVKISALSA